MIFIKVHLTISNWTTFKNWLAVLWNAFPFSKFLQNASSKYINELCHSKDASELKVSRFSSSSLTYCTTKAAANTLFHSIKRMTFREHVQLLELEQSSGTKVIKSFPKSIRCFLKFLSKQTNKKINKYINKHTEESVFSLSDAKGDVSQITQQSHEF